MTWSGATINLIRLFNFTLLYSTLLHQVLVKVEDEVENEFEVALLYFACIDSCARLLYFTLQNVIKHSVVVWYFPIIIPIQVV